MPATSQFFSKIILTTPSSNLILPLHMNPITYIISNYGEGIAVGVVARKDIAQQEAILAENLYNLNHTDELFGSLIYFPDIRLFKKFLIMKEYYLQWDLHNTRNRVAKTRTPSNISKFTREAIKQAKLVLESQVSFENFMSRITTRNNEYSFSC